MLVRYKGGRSRYEISLNRKPYYFIPENNMICDIKEQAVVNYIFSLSNRAEFEAVMEETKLSEPAASKPQELSEPDSNATIITVKKKNKSKKQKGGRKWSGKN